jgi:hypothetical protein
MECGAPAPLSQSNPPHRRSNEAPDHNRLTPNTSLRASNPEPCPVTIIRRQTSPVIPNEAGRRFFFTFASERTCRPAQ